MVSADELDRKIKFLSEKSDLLLRQIESLKKMRDFVKDNPECVQHIDGVPYDVDMRRGQFFIHGGTATKNNFEIIANLFDREGYPELSMKEIVSRTLLKKSSVIQVLYKTHGMLFRGQKRSGNNKNVYWSLDRGWVNVPEAVPSGIARGGRQI